jgi:Protein of unknown function (DUF3050)
MQTPIEQLKSSIQPTREALLSHIVYRKINDFEGLKLFTKYHIFAVWDFMSLLKSLQMGLTCVSLPWIPVGSANTRFLINEIVTGEESDIDEQGNRVSHFELYLSAMRQMGADTSKMDQLLSLLKSGSSINDCIETLEIPSQVKQFLQFTFDIAMHAPLHVKAAVFTFGREDLIPDMFTQILNKIHAEHPDKVSIFKYYIERHIEVDGGHHSELAIEMVSELCGDNAEKWEEATKAAIDSLKIRAFLWDAVCDNNFV